MRVPALSILLVSASLSCGPGSNSSADGSSSAACSIAVGGVQIGVAAVPSAGTTLSCSGSIDNAEVQCGSTATLSQVNCSDGYAFEITGGSETLYVRMQSQDQQMWSCGAQFASGLALNGNITFSSIPPPTQFHPSSGTQEEASFVFSGTSGQGVDTNGTIQASW